MTYAELLNESYENNVMNLIPENDTFKAIDKFMTENFSFIMNESADFENMTISLEDVVFTEADEVDAKATKEKVGDAIIRRIKEFVGKIGEWLKKIGEAIARVFGKVNAAIAIKQGEKSQLKIQKVINKYPEAEIQVMLDLKAPKIDRLKAALKIFEESYSKVSDVGSDWAENLTGSHLATADFTSEMEGLKNYMTKLDTFKKDIKTSDEFWENARLTPGTKVEAAYKKMQFNEVIKLLADAVSSFRKDSEDAITAVKKARTVLEQKAKLDKNAEIGTGNIKSSIGNLIKLTSTIMQATGSGLNLIASITRVTVANSNKLCAQAKVGDKYVAKVVPEEEEDAAAVAD